MASTGPSTPAAAPAARPTPGSSPVRLDPAAAADSVPNDASTYDPMDNGEVGLNTRSMFKNRSGRPRSWISATVPAAAPEAASSRQTRVSAGRPVSSAPSARTAAAPLIPPTNRYSGTSGCFHTGRLITGRP